MAWNRKYWDILNQIYWTPKKYMGLESISKEKCNYSPPNS